MNIRINMILNNIETVDRNQYCPVHCIYIVPIWISLVEIYQYHVSNFLKYCQKMSSTN